jgi:hypothetical protein
MSNQLHDTPTKPASKDQRQTHPRDSEMIAVKYHDSSNVLSIAPRSIFQTFPFEDVVSTMSLFYN